MTGAAPRLVHDPEGLNTAAWPIQPDLLITPVHQFFTRSHASVPRIDPRTWRLEVGGLVDRPRSLTLGDLGKFAQRQVDATLVCAGLRRAEFLALGPLPGELPWGPEPISTGRWTGVALRDVLSEVGVADRAGHVEFVGLDRVARKSHTFGFGGSIALDKAWSGEVLLATELNGAPLPAEHGFPARVVVPGWIGARSVKWLGRITVMAEPSSNYFQSAAYRVQREINPHNPRDVSAGAALSEVPLNSVILEPTPGQVVRRRARVRGWAMGSAGRRVTAVELSSDGGEHWTQARLGAEGSGWTWTLWEAEVVLSPGRHVLVVRATDSVNATQPETVRETWNVKGYANNAWHRVPIRVQ